MPCVVGLALATLPVTSVHASDDGSVHGPTNDAQGAPWTIFLNFEGQETPRGTVLPFTGDVHERANIARAVRRSMADFHVWVTDQRPTSGDYDTEMIGDFPMSFPGMILGFAPTIDCNNEDGGDISYTFETTGSVGPGGSRRGPAGFGTVILQELAHSWGLEHTDNPTDLLYPTVSGARIFVDACERIVSDTNLSPTDGWCRSQHALHCDAGFQNSYQDVMTLFGPRGYEPVAPEVEVVTPEDGGQTGADVLLTIRVEDDYSPSFLNIQIDLDGSGPQDVGHWGVNDVEQEIEFALAGLPEGEHTVTFSVTDEDGLSDEAAVGFTVVGGAQEPEGEDDGDETSGETEIGTSGNPDDPSETDTQGPDDSGAIAPSSDGTGCACATTTAHGWPMWTLAVLLPVVRRRRPRPGVGAPSPRG